MKWSIYNIDFEMEDGRMGVYNTFTNSFVVLEKDYFNEIKQDLNSNKLINDDFPKSLIGSHVVENDNYFLEILKYKSLEERFRSNTLDIVIAPTSDCNFACPYCFEENKPQWYMDDVTTQNLIKFIKSYKNKPVHITWFGGEPLMYKKKIKEITDLLIEANIDFNSSILTNGYLLNKSFIEELVNLRIKRVQVTLDGTESVHNLHRPHKKGLKTFDKIIENLDKLLPYANKNNIKVTIPVTIDMNNKDDFEEIFNYLKNRYLTELNNNVLVITINFVKDRKNSLSCRMDVNDRINFFLNIADNRKVDKYLAEAFLLPGKSIATCMMRSINSFGIGPKGCIYKCLEDFTDPEKSIGNINEGLISYEKIAHYTVGNDVFEDPVCITCSMLPICVGGCPYDILNSENEHYHENNCTIYKNNLDKILPKYYSTFKKDS
jgi:uncharacterized protein